MVTAELDTNNHGKNCMCMQNAMSYATCVGHERDHH